MRILGRVLTAARIDKVDEAGRKLDIALRHTYRTRLLRARLLCAGAGLYQVQKLLGHSDPKLTAETYPHLVVDDLRDVVDLLPGGGPRRAIPGTEVAQDSRASDGDAAESLPGMERPKRFELSTFSLGSGAEGEGASEDDSGQERSSEDESAGCDDPTSRGCDENADT